MPAIRQTGLLLLALVLAAVWTGAARAWTSAGPWGGVIHDLENSPAGADTLYAATANGIYVFGGSLPWTQFEQTKGMRVLQIAPDPYRGVIYAVARPGTDPFDFGGLEQDGTLYRLDLAAGNLTAMLSTEVSAIAVDGSGTLFAGANEAHTDTLGYSSIKGYIYRFDPGSTTPVRIDPGYPSYPIQALMAAAGTGTVYAARYLDGGFPKSDIIAGNMSWVLDSTLPDTERIASLGSDAAGAPLAGTADGVVYSRATGAWQAYGTGLPAYPVVGFGADHSGKTFAVLRKHVWDDDYADNTEPGLYYYLSGFWIRNSAYDKITTAARTILTAGGYDWVGFDMAGIWRVPSGGTPPGEEADEGIAAVNLSGIVIDPESQDRALAYGPGGLYERLGGTWRRVVIGNVTLRAGTCDHPDVADKEQGVRDGGFMSAAFSADDPDVIWAGGALTGLSRGARLSSGSPAYSFDRLYCEGVGGQRISDILADPFDAATVYWATTGKGAHLTRDDGSTHQVVPGTTSLVVNDLDWDLDEPRSRSALAGFGDPGSGPGGKGVLAAESGGSSFYSTSFFDTSLYYWTSVTALAFNPRDMGSRRAVAGPLNNTATMAIANTGGGWSLDATVQAPQGLPSSAQFNAIKIPLGYDADRRADAFAALIQNGTGVAGLYHSAADTLDGSPGAVWTEITGELLQYGPTSVTVHPKDGNLLWATTRTGSAFTLYGTHDDDTVPPGFSPGYPLEVLNAVHVRQGIAGTIELRWHAPGDDGDMPGWADHYELYFRNDHAIDDTSDISDPLGDPNLWVDYPPVPHIAHREELYSVDISGISGTEFSLALVAFDEQGLSSPMLTASVGAVPAGTVSSPSSSGGGGGGCFIATAAYGSPMAPEVDVFRGYRDRYLVKRAWGRALLRCYYALSPGPAAFISDKPALTAAARIMLTPILMAVQARGEDSAVPVLVGFGVVFLPAGFVFLGIMVIISPRRFKADLTRGTQGFKRGLHRDDGDRGVEV